MKRLVLAAVLLMCQFPLPGRPAQKKLERSRCHVFIDFRNIWTFEMVQSKEGKRVPILNIITFTPGEWEMKPAQIHIINSKDKEARIDRFSLDTGIADEPYLSKTMKVLGNGFIGVDLVGDFRDFAEPSRVYIDLGENRFELEPIDCLEFEMIAEQINKVNVDSPKIKEDFDTLKIAHRGKLNPRPPQR